MAQRNNKGYFEIPRSIFFDSSGKSFVLNITEQSCFRYIRTKARDSRWWSREVCKYVSMDVDVDVVSAKEAWMYLGRKANPKTSLKSSAESIQDNK